jgi:DNA-binding GntR family transcriptional regulator
VTGPSLAESRAESPAFARERVHQAIRRGIILRTLLPGQQVPEADLAASLGVSRTPVREALRELEEQGLVVSFPHRGCFIRSFTSKDISNLIYLRAAVEGMAAWQAVEHASRAEMRRLEHLVALMAASEPYSTEPDRPATQVVDLEFHETLVALSGNDELVRVWQHVDPLIRTFQGHDLRPAEEDTAAYRRRLVERHQQVVSALLAGDASLAEQAARGHVIDAGLRVTAAMRRLEEAHPAAPVRDIQTYRRR